jgi:hypothetical protein
VLKLPVRLAGGDSDDGTLGDQLTGSQFEIDLRICLLGRAQHARDIDDLEDR